jgi:DNA helicase HerA-like ATPase
LVLAGLIHQDKAVNVIFDMHSEYGLQARKEGNKESFVKGLKTLFPDKVVIFSLDPASTRRRGGQADVDLTLSYSSIAVEDIISLDSELNLNPTAYEAAYLIAAHYKKNWLKALLSQGDSLKEFAQQVGAHPESIAALYRKLKSIERLPFITAESQPDVITQMMEYIDSGKSIIIEFGNFTSTFCYLLIANIITRRLHDLYIKKTEQFLGSQRTIDEPKKLMITIEEAHKFLNPSAAKQTIFGTIAREMRKYYVSLLVVDQRPSGIDTEILSQIGTKIVAQLNDEKDIAATLTGVNNASQLRTVLGGLESKKQVILLGHAVAMPVVIQTREYDEKFYSAMMHTMAGKPVKQLIEDMF